MFADRKIDGTIFEDSERAVFIGYMGMDSWTYALENLLKIDDIQMQGGAYISIFDNSHQNARRHFENCLETYFQNSLGTVFINKDTHDYLEGIMNNPDTYHMSYEEVIDEITRLAHGLDLLKPIENEIIKQLANNKEFNKEIAKSFGKSVNTNGDVILQSVDSAGNILTYVDSSGVTRALMYQWWNNFRRSKATRSGTYIGNMYYQIAHTIPQSLFSNMGIIRAYYKQLNPTHVPNWIKELDKLPSFSKIDLESYWRSL